MTLIHSLNKRHFYNTEIFPRRKFVLFPPSKLLFIKKRSVCSVLFLSTLCDEIAVDDVQSVFMGDVPTVGVDWT